MKLFSQIILLFFLSIISLSESSKPTVCKPGTFKSGNTCTDCPIDTFSTTENASSCTPCQPKSSTFEGGANSSSACAFCPNGFRISKFDTNRAECQDCLPNEFGMGRHGCRMCPPGTSTSDLAETSCTVCGPGTRSTNSIEEAIELGACPDCPDGFFSPRFRLTKCLKCPAGSVPDPMRIACVRTCDKKERRGKKNKKKRHGNWCFPWHCRAGRVRKGRYGWCRLCPRGTVAIKGSVTGCSSCPANMVPNYRRNKCVCDRFSLPVPNNGGPTLRCEACPAPSIKRNGKCVCLRPNGFDFRGNCICPQRTRLVGRNCKNCSKIQIKRTIEGGTADMCVLCSQNSIFNEDKRRCVQCPTGKKRPFGSTSPCV